MSSITPPLHHSIAPALSRRFLGWDGPVLDSVVAHLARDWNHEGSLDLSDHLVVVPTRQAGRRLREALARHAAKFDSAVLPPLVVTPNFLFAPARLGEADTPAATSQTAHLLWTALLLRLPPSSFSRVFPVEPVERNLDWASGNAREFLSVRDLLVESGLDFRVAASRLAEIGIETSRWEELAALEAAAVKLISATGFRDPGLAALEAANHGVLPETVSHLVVAAVPDLRPLAAHALDHHAKSIPTTVLVPAPESEANTFDHYGRPLPSFWLEREIALSSPDHTLHACATPADQADRCHQLLAPYPDPAACAAIGLPDPDIAPTLEQRLAVDGLGTYDPAGKPLSREGIHHLLALTHRLVSGNHYDTFRLLLRCPGFAAAMLPRGPREGFAAGRLLETSDRLAADHLPGTLDDALTVLNRNPDKSPSLTSVLSGAIALVTRFEKGDFTDVLCDFLASVFAERRFAPHDPDAAVYTEVADTIHTLEADLAITSSAFPTTPDTRERFALLLSSLAEQNVYPERGPRDLDLQGWLELLWEDAPHLLVTGMNDHAVPEAVVGHAFLPNSARSLLGVPDNNARFARDAFLLSVLVATRRETGRLDLLFGRLTSAGDPLRPSRLLFQCQDSELAARTLRLFKEGNESHAPLARTVAWRLRPAPLPADHRIFSKISVTGFKTYLACPFRYYLKHGLGMEAVEASKSELDSRDFGNLVHAALEAYGRNEDLRSSCDASVVAATFEAEVDDWLSRHFGSVLSTPLLIQREAAIRRLAHWAVIEAEQRAAGWEILETEAVLGKEDWPFSIEGLPVTGRIDRIERHPSLGLRVFDFKTLSPMENGRIKTVDRHHLVNVKRTEDPTSFPDWALTVDAKGKPLRWVDLQIPLYHLALSARFPGESVAAGYVTLGRTAEEVRIDQWEALDEPTLTSAHTCAAGVITAIRDGIFWPPNEQMPEWDEFRDLLSPTAAEAVDPSGLGAVTRPA